VILFLAEQLQSVSHFISVYST